MMSLVFQSLLILVISACAVAFPCSAQISSRSPQHLFFRVTLGPQQKQAVSGRLLILLEPGKKTADVRVDEFRPTSVSVAAMDVSNWNPGESIDIDTDSIAYPTGFSRLPAGDYVAQAVLDTSYKFAYYGPVDGDLESAPTPMSHWTPGSGAQPQLTLARTVKVPARPWLSSQLTQAMRERVTGAVHELDIESPALTRFWGRPMHLRGWVVLPPAYSKHARQHYPTVYWTHGFGGTHDGDHVFAGRIYQRMAEGYIPPMIWVVLDQDTPRGTHEFADSVNNGPWGTALTTEAIPALEREYRMDAKPRGRFLQGHSSGGWATLWLQVRYPKIFGGTWSTSPDPTDFHDFTGVDLYAAHANVYTKSNGSAYPLVRDKGKVLATFEQLTRLEDVLGPYGGQIASFDWVFSPRGPGGRPERMFNHANGDVDPAVVDYWRQHYDIAHRVKEQWPTIGRDLRGKVHLYVGTADTFYLDGAAHRLDAVFKSLHADEQFTFIPGRTHFDLYRVGKDQFGLFDQIAAQMYTSARPRAHWQPRND